MSLKYKITDNGHPILLKIEEGEWITADTTYSSHQAAKNIINAATEKLRTGYPQKPEVIEEQDKRSLRVEGERWFIQYGRVDSFALIDKSGNYTNQSTPFKKKEAAQAAIADAVKINMNGVEQDMSSSHRSNLSIDTKYTRLT